MSSEQKRTEMMNARIKSTDIYVSKDITSDSHESFVIHYKYSIRCFDN